MVSHTNFVFMIRSLLHNKSCIINYIAIIVQKNIQYVIL